ncbi:MAG: hypothetical protein MK008_09690 [Bdellovibrionales bacterium]|nr:hypothetical protein [Bdellovibrionales bacterium]
MQQQNNRPVSKNGFKLFILGLLTAFMVGHFFKFYFNSNRLTQFFENKLIEQNLDFEFKISGINYVLADGVWPTFGFYIEDLIITADDVCKLPLQIVLKDSLIKIKTLKSLIDQKIQLSSTQVGSARVLHSKALCEEAKLPLQDTQLEALLYEADNKLTREIAGEKEMSSAKRRKNLKAKIVKSSNQLKKQLTVFFDRNEAYLENWPDINVDEIFYIKDGQNVVLQNFSVSSGDKQLEIDTDLNFSFSKLELQGLPNITLNFIVSKPELKTTVFTRYKEGRVQTNLNIDWLTLDYNLTTNVFDLPIHSLLNWLKQQELYQQQWQPELLWLTCKMESEGALIKPSQIEFVLEPCIADAEKGQFEFKNLKLDPFNLEKFKPFMVNVTNIPIQSFLKSLNKPGPYRIFSEFGSLSGEVTVNSLKQLEANWRLSNLEAIFSKNGVNAFQKIEFLDVKMSYDKQRLSGLIDNVNLVSGNFDGSFSYNFNQSLQEGMLQFNIKSFEFNSEVQSLLVGNSMSGVSLYGQARIIDSELSKWRGNIGVKSIKSFLGSLNTLKVDFDYVAPKLQANLKVKDITTSPKDSYYDLINSLSLDFSSDSPVNIKNLNANIISFPGQGEWKNLKAVLINNDKKFNLKSEGGWFEKAFSGSIMMSDTLNQKWEWLLLGSLKELYLAPSSQLIEQVQKSKLKGYTLPKNKFQKGMSKTEFKDIDFKKASPLELLKSLGVSFIESARKIIPEDKKD